MYGRKRKIYKQFWPGNATITGHRLCMTERGRYTNNFGQEIPQSRAIDYVWQKEEDIQTIFARKCHNHGP